MDILFVSNISLACISAIIKGVDDYLNIFLNKYIFVLSLRKIIRYSRSTINV